MSDLLSSIGGLAPVGFVALGLALGMRHATDPDHVIAVTAILTRERRLFAATRTGLPEAEARRTIASGLRSGTPCSQAGRP